MKLHIHWMIGLLVASVSWAPSPSVAAPQSDGESAEEASTESVSTGPVPFQPRSFKFGFGTGFQIGADAYLGPTGHLGLDFYHVPPIGGDCEETCWTRTHGQLSWGPTWRSKLLHAGLDFGVAAGTLFKQVRPDVAWKGLAVGPLAGARTSWTLTPAFSLGLEFAVAPVYWFHSGNLFDAESAPSPDRLRWWATGAFVLEFGSVRSPA